MEEKENRIFTSKIGLYCAKEITLQKNQQTMGNWQERTALLLGEKGMKKLSEASVLIVGLGGVGGISAEMICRAGVGKMTIVDRDTVNESNINRQIIALQTTVGLRKADALAKRLLQINPELKLHVINDWLTAENTEELLDKEKFDYVVDAIDTLQPKVFLIKSCVEKKIPVISSMGAGGKMDASQIKITDISKTISCGLARAVRKRLSKVGIKTGVPTVFSTELVNKDAIILTDEEYKRSTAGTVSYMPATFGCLLASHVIQQLSNKK